MPSPRPQSRPQPRTILPGIPGSPVLGQALTAVLLSVLLALHAGCVPRRPAATGGIRPAPARVLILGDSISMAYTGTVATELGDEARVVRPMLPDGRAENCEGTTRGVAGLEDWLAAEGGRWDVIHFNFGLHDLKRVDPAGGAPSPSAEHPRQADPAVYERQLDRIVTRLARTGATLILATTTPVPGGGVRPHRDPADVDRYNAIARRVAARHGARINDLNRFAAPRLADWQQPVNVHFNEAGSAALGREVAGHIRRALRDRARGDGPRRTGSPNVVVILADDLGWGDLRAYNPDSRIPTPHLDRLARESLRFTDAHSPSGVCTPTRYGLMTGRYAWRTRLKQGVLWGWSPPLLEPDRLNLATLFKRQGYRTAVAGKWHLGLGWPTPAPAAFGDTPVPAADPALVEWTRPLAAGPHTAGFDRSLVLPASLDMPPYVLVEDGRVRDAPDREVPASRARRDGGDGFWRAGPIASDLTHDDVLPRITAEAVRFLEAQPRGEPFFLYLPLTAPHTPWLPAPEFRGRSGAGWYGDFVAMVDDTVGRVLGALRQSGHADDTLVVFTSDNGAHWLPADIRTFGHRANGPWRGQKSDWWEGGHRVPFLVRWPGRLRPGVTDALVCHTDLLATFAALLGEPLPEDAAEDSLSFLPVILGRTNTVRTHLVSHSGNGGFAVRQDGWKLCDGLGSRGFSQPADEAAEPGGPAGQLYHLPTDPSESRNLWLREPARRAALAELLAGIRSGTRTRP